MNPIATNEARSARWRPTTLPGVAPAPAARTPEGLRSPRTSERRDSRTDPASTCRATDTRQPVPVLQSSALARAAGRCWSCRRAFSRNSLHAAMCHRAMLVFVRNLRDDRFRGEQQTCDRRGVLERRANDFRWINDAGLQLVLVVIGLRVESLVAVHLPHPSQGNR